MLLLAIIAECCNNTWLKMSYYAEGLRERVIIYKVMIQAMERKVLRSLLSKSGKSYNKDELTKKILRGIRKCYRHHYLHGHTRKEKSDVQITLLLLDDFLH